MISEFEIRIWNSHMDKVELEQMKFAFAISNFESAVEASTQ